MIIRGTAKLLKISGIKPVKNIETTLDMFPGEWYASVVKTGHVGKLVLLLFHNNTKISIICPTKSLNSAINQFPQRLSNFLVRHGFDSLIDKFDMNSSISIYTTESRSTLAYMNQLSATIECHLYEKLDISNYDYKELEDILTEYLFSINGKSTKYETSLEILKRI